MEDVNLLTGFTAGLLSFLTPCVLPMVPVYLMYLTGSFKMDNLKEDRWKTFSRSLSFVLGFTIVFVLLGLSATALGKFLIKNKALLRKIGAVMVVIFGLIMTKIISFKKLKRRNYMKLQDGFFGSVLMGMAFSIGWSPCFGPVVGMILSIAAQKDTLLKGAALLFAYSLGLGIPFIISGFFAGAIRNYFNKHTLNMDLINKITGYVMIIFGLLMYFDLFRYLR